jgi:hypothetical protein
VFRIAAWLLFLAVAVAACSRAPADLREWRPSDHDRSDEPDGGAAPKPGLR